MKKVIFLSLIICVFLCGCKNVNIFSSEEPEYLVSAIGFKEGFSGQKTIFLESIVINTEDTEAEKKRITLKGKGDSLEESYLNAKEKAVQPINLSHCSVVILKENSNFDFFEEVCDFCYNKDPINLAAFFIYTPDIKELLNQDPISSISVGFDIMSRLSSTQNYKNRFYQIESVRKSEKKGFDIPLLKDGIFIKKGA